MIRIKTLAIIQARVSSTRLPAKVLKEVCGKPLLQLMVERAARSKKADLLVVATSLDPSDDSIKILCDRMGVPCFRGSLGDVLDRFYQTALLYQPQEIVRLTGDCPLIDPAVVDQVIDFRKERGLDYASNVLQPSFPNGLDCEVFVFRALEEAWKEARLGSQREHVTPFIWQQPERYKIGNFAYATDVSGRRLTVDEPRDLDLITRVFEALYPKNPGFDLADVLKLLAEHPEWDAINAGIDRHEGFARSLAADKAACRLDRSLALQDKAKARIAGMTQLLSKRPDMFTQGVWPGYFSKASGVEVWDLDGNRYVDMSIGGIGANVLGYCDPDVDQAVIRAVRNGNSTSLNCPEEVELAEQLCRLHPWAGKARFARTGGESMAVAVRIARAHTGRSVVAFCGYHGWHDWYLAANLNGRDALGHHLIPGLEPAGVPRQLTGTAFPFTYNDLDGLRKIVESHGGDLAAIVMEPIRAQQPKPGFFEGVREIANKTGAVLVVDEISAGLRLCTGGAHLVLGLTPDIAVFSKALGNGYPIGAILGRPDVMDAAQKSFISSSYWTERVGFVAALATLKKHEQNRVHEHLIRIGNRVQAGWRQAADRAALPIAVSGIAPLSHFEFKGPEPLERKAFFIQEMLKRGFLATNLFYSMFAHQDAHVDAYLAVAGEVFERLAVLVKTGKLRASLEGAPSVSGFRRLN